MKNYSEFDSNKIGFIYFVVMELPSGTIYANTSDRDITIDYNGTPTKFVAVGMLGEISDCEVSDGTEAKAVKFQLNGIPSSLGGVLINENTRNKVVKSYMVVCNSNNEILTPLIMFFQGSIDSMSVNGDVELSVSISATSRLINWRYAVNSRYTNEDQKSRYPTDRGFQFVNSLADLKITWGAV